MGLFGQKPIYKYKTLERFRISTFELEKFKIIGETFEFKFYLYTTDSLSNKYILRQEKNNPKNVVYFGEAKGNMSIYHNKLFCINRINHNSRTNHPLYCIDIYTGIYTELNVLSNKGCYIAMHWHCQDCVESMSVINNSLILEVTRYKEESHYEEEMKYKILITGEGNLFTKEYQCIQPINRQSESVCDNSQQIYDNLQSQTKKYFDELVMLTVGLPAALEEAREENMSILKNEYVYCDSIILTEFFIRTIVLEIVPSKDMAIKFSDEYITAVIKETIDTIPEVKEYFMNMFYNRAMLYDNIMMTTKEPIKEIVNLAAHIMHCEIDKNTYVEASNINFRYYGGMLENTEIVTELGILISCIYDCTTDTVNELRKSFNNN